MHLPLAIDSHHSTHDATALACRFGGTTSVAIVTHGLTLRVFLMRWLHWSVDQFLQVYNAPTATPIVLTRLNEAGESNELPEGKEQHVMSVACELKCKSWQWI